MNIDYNFTYDMKYMDIYKELTEKSNELCNEDEKYSTEDLDDVCHKLYVDEYSSIFNADTYMDDKIDVTLREIFYYFNSHLQLTILIQSIFQIYKDFVCKDVELGESETNDLKYISFLGLFSFDTCYLTHQIIHHLSTNLMNNIPQNLIDDTISQFQYSLQSK